MKPFTSYISTKGVTDVGEVDRSHVEDFIATLKPLHVQLIRLVSKRGPFTFGDTPVVHFTGVRVGWRDRLALGDADRIDMPLAPWAAAMFTTSRSVTRP